jgi:hypothetical protein
MLRAALLGLLAAAGAGCSSAAADRVAGSPAADSTAGSAVPSGVVAVSRARSASPVVLGSDANQGSVVAAQVLAAVGQGPATDAPTYARADEGVTLYALVTVEIDGKQVRYSDAPSVHLAGKAVTAKPLAEAPRLSLAWNRVESAVTNISNGEPDTFHYERIDYRTTAIAGATGASLAADVRPTLISDYGDGVGTMRYQVVVTQGTGTVASPGSEARRSGASGGLTDAVLRVSIRKDDTFLGYLTEMINQPYIWASAGRTDAQHQSERLEGSDCADLMVYAQRRTGAKLAYTWTGALPDVTKKLGGGTRGDDGIYRDAGGNPVAFTRPGDLVLFPRHVGALVEDRGTVGVLDDQDVMFHTLFDAPKAQAIADSGYADKPVEVRRFK